MISIISPVYNVEKYIDNFIQSILNQTFTDFELLLVTDCPTDNSLIICEKYQHLDSRIRIIKQEKNSGVSKARNRGLCEAKGDYVMLADSDDYLPKDSLQYLYDMIKSSNSDIAIGGFYFDIEGEIELKKFKFFKNIYNRNEAIRCHLNFHTIYGYPWGKLFKKEVLKNIRVPEDMSLGEDGVFSFLTLINATSIAFTTYPVYYYRVRRDSLSGRGNNFEVRDLDVFKQIDYIKQYIENEKYYEFDLKIFIFALLYGSIKKYNNSNEYTKNKFKKEYNEMKRLCKEYCNTVIFRSINPRLKLLALKYKFE